MNVRKTELEGLLVLEPRVFRDNRGYFYESYHRDRLKEAGIHMDFVQDNQSRSGRGVIRGLHFQREPNAQAKLIRAVEGVIYDVAVDIRKNSPTFGRWYGLEISARNHLQILIPAGFAHGFSVLSANATIHYKCDAYYHPDSESGIRFDDPDLRIDWRIASNRVIVSEKDRDLPYFKDK
jgi:dTDP-4-dehydrorhamnose 3,5-epimerase